MALIGSIAISMTANTAPLAAGIARASKIMKTWNASASADFGAGGKSIRAGLSKAGEALDHLGYVAADSWKNLKKNPFVGLGKAWGGYILSEASEPIASSFKHVFGSVGSAVRSQMAPALGFVKAGARETAGALNDTFGVAGRAVFSRLAKESKLFGAALGKSNIGPAILRFAQLGSGALTAAGGLGKVAVGLGKVGWGAASAGASAFASVLSSVAGVATRVVGTVSKLSVLGGAAFAVLAVKSAASAAHLTEAVNKTEQVFGGSSKHVLDSATAMGNAYGTGAKEYLDGAAALGGQLQGVGYAEKDAAALSVQLANLAADAGAFRDVGFDEALTKIRAGLSGESEPLKAWGVLIDENAVKVEALRLGLIKQGQEMDNSAKVQARLSLIQKGLAKDSGALSRESTGTAAQMSEFWGRLGGLWDTVGGSFEEGVGGALQYVNQGLAMLTDNWGALSEAVMGFVSSAGSAIAGWAQGLFETFGLGAEASGVWSTALDSALGGVANGWQMVGIAARTVMLGITSAVQAILGALAKVGAAFDWISKKTTGSSAGIGDYLSGLADAVKKSTTTQAEGLVDAWAKPWASADGGAQKIKDFFGNAAATAQDAWTAAGEKIRAAREELAKPAQVDVEGPSKSATAAAKGEKQGFAAAMTRGSAEAAQAVLRHRYGGTGRDPVASNTKRTADGVGKLGSKLDKLNEKIGAMALPAVPVFNV